MAGTAGVRYNFNGQQNAPEVPLFERQMGNDDYVEFQQLRMLIQNLQQRVDSLEKINVDLEYRLEDQAKQSMAVEKECLLIEQRWKKKNEELSKDINHWKGAFEQELHKGDKLREQLNRTERELYGILQRKYQFMHGTKPGALARNPPGPDLSTMKKNEGHNASGSWDADLFQNRKVRCILVA